ncbi:MAG: DUF2381 family protein [Deltaproteobacteria bacterium]|nr:DUF2381 family protein [Deltaproteobacteria bacterium]
MKKWWLLIMVAVALVVPKAARAQQAKEFLVPPAGGTYEITVHPAFVTALSFPEKLSPKALASDLRDNYDIKPNGEDGISIRPLKADAKPANITLQTISGAVRVSLTLRVVSDTKDALTLVSFRQTSEDEAFKQRVADQVAKETAALRDELAKAKADLDKRIRSSVDEVVAKRALARLETHGLKAVERNSDNVIVRVPRVVYLGDDALLYFDVENRDRSPYRLAKVQVMTNGKDYAGAVQFASDTATHDDAVLGVVPASGRGQGVVVVRQWSQLVGRGLTLVVEQPEGRGRVAVDRIVLR